MDDTGGWRFAQAFGDKGDIEEITEGAPIEWRWVQEHATDRTPQLISYRLSNSTQQATSWRRATKGAGWYFSSATRRRRRASTSSTLSSSRTSPNSTTSSRSRSRKRLIRLDGAGG